MSTGRRGARRAALFVLYQWDVTGQPLASLYEGDLDAYTKELAEGVAAEVDDLDATIGDASSDWRPERLGALERNSSGSPSMSSTATRCRSRLRSTKRSGLRDATRLRTLPSS